MVPCRKLSPYRFINTKPQPTPNPNASTVQSLYPISAHAGQLLGGTRFGVTCPLGICVVLVPDIGISTSVSNTTQLRPQHFRIFNTTQIRPQHFRNSTGNVRDASAKYWSNYQHIQPYTNMPTVLQKCHVYPLTMCVVLVPNIGISTSISNTTQICPQHFRNLMCVHWECTWC